MCERQCARQVWAPLPREVPFGANRGQNSEEVERRASMARRCVADVMLRLTCKKYTSPPNAVLRRSRW
jgi:hypothetical protein